jgi:hypothetical protein
MAASFSYKRERRVSASLSGFGAMSSSLVTRRHRYALQWGSVCRQCSYVVMPSRTR